MIAIKNVEVSKMDFSASFQDSEKRKMGIVIFFFTLIFILSIVWADGCGFR